MELFKSFLLMESQDPEQKAKAKIVKKEINDRLKQDNPVQKTSRDDVDSSGSAKLAFVFRAKNDQYSGLEQSDNPELVRELKKVYSLFGADKERGRVYGISQTLEKDFSRVLRNLGVSTDGEISLDRLKRAGFATTGRILNKRIVKRGNAIVTVTPSTDSHENDATIYMIQNKEAIAESLDEDIED